MVRTNEALYTLEELDERQAAEYTEDLESDYAHAVEYIKKLEQENKKLKKELEELKKGST